jgi:UDP-3-O-[3-hydroxymyristoyl] glucosamine N-acyltransferase
MKDSKIFSYNQVTSSELIIFLTERDIDHIVLGPLKSFTGVAQLEHCESGHLVWCKTLTPSVHKARASVIIAPRSDIVHHDNASEKMFVFVDNPRETFRIILAELFSDQIEYSKGLSDNKMFECFGNKSWVALSATIASSVKLGECCVIHPGAILYPNVSLGDNVEIGPGSIVGAPGYGHVRDTNGKLNHFPHIGGVVVGSNVTVGNNTCIDSGGLSPTLIGAGCKIGNLTQIAHNVVLEEDCLIGTRCQIAGGTVVGKCTEVWAGSTISNNRRIGKNCSIKIGSIVISNLADNSIVSGNFATSHKARMAEFKKLAL